MGENRVFVSQETLDKWLTDGRVEVDGETMTLRPEGQKFNLKSAVHFVTEVTDEGDPHRLLNRVKDLEQLAETGGEHYSDSVLVGDTAYQVVEGFVGEPIAEAASVPTGHSLASATRAATGDGTPSGEIDLLARFFLSSSGSE